MCHQSTVAIVCDLGFDEKNKREREASGSGSSTVCGGGQNLIHFLLQSPKGNLPTVYHLYGLKGRGKRGENLGRSFGWIVVAAAVVKNHKGLSLISFLRKLIGAWVAIYDSRNLNDDHNDFGQDHSVMFWPTQVANNAQCALKYF